MKTSIVSLLVALSFTASAGFMDSLKSVGAGIVDGAGKLADATVNATTSCVNSVTMEVAPNPATPGETVQREKESVQKLNEVETATDAQVEKSEVQTPRAVARQRQMTETKGQRDVGTAASANKKTSFKSAKMGVAESNSEAEQALKLAVDYLSHDFVRQMNEIMAKDKEHTRYRRSIRSFYSHVSVQMPFKEQWQRISCSKYPEVPDLDPGDVRVPCTVSEFEEWKSTMQANLKKEYDYWGKEELKAARKNKLKDFLEKTFRPQVQVLLQAEKERYNGFSDTIWNKTWHIDEHLVSTEGEGFYVSRPECVPLVLLDGKETRCKPNDVDRWIKTAKKWLARTRKIVDRECFIDGYSLKWFAEAHGVTNIEPFKVYKDIAFGDGVGTVFKKLKALDSKAKWEELSGSRFEGEVAKNIPNGKILQSVLKNHILLFTFGSLEEDAGSALVSAKITFRNNLPTRDALVEKYMALPSTKKYQEKIEVGKKWKKDEVSSFWCIFSKFAGTQLQMTALSGSGELGGMPKEEEKGLENLMKDLDAIKKDHMEGVFMDSTVIDSDVATVSVRVMADTGKVSDVIIEDKAVTALMEKKQKELSKANAERAKKEKEAAKKKATADAVSF